MTTSNRLCRLLSSGAATTMLLVGSAFAQDEIHGTWECTLSAEDPQSGTSLSAEFEQTYDANGTYEREGEMTIVIAAAQVNLTIALEEAGTWRWVDTMVLGETQTEAEFSSTSAAPSQIEQMLVQQMQSAADAASGEETVEITTLTSTMMGFEDDDGTMAQCQKA